MAWVTKQIDLTDDYQLLLDNTGQGDAKENGQNFFYVNTGSAEFYFSTDDPDPVPGLRVSAGARFMPVPEGCKLYGRLTQGTSIGVKEWQDACSVFVCYETASN